METSASITAAVFSAYLSCPTKAYLLAHGEKSIETLFDDMRGNVSTAYKAKMQTALSVDFSELAWGSNSDSATVFVDSETAFYPGDQSASAKVGRRTRKTQPSREYIPVLYSAWDKLEKSDHLLVSFCALAIGQAAGIEIPPKGKIVWGDSERIKTVKIADHLSETRRVLEAIATESNCSEPPSLVLNKHCPVCDFQSRCRAIAISREDLSLLRAMTMKERTKYAEKGIATITQLSYGYRPRRRRRIKATSQPGDIAPKHDHRLKALAIKKAQTHVVGSPAFSVEGTLVFMDVEGMPDRDFYYLIGLRYERQGAYVERSFWADQPDDECGIWQECLRTLKGIDNPRIVHYGAYESRFLKLMRERWKPTDEDLAFVDQIIAGSLNLLAIIYGKIYFPTYSNGLKEIARWLGFEWKWPQASGGGALLLRRCWELTSDSELQRRLISYNIEDCQAAQLAAQGIAVICGNGEQDGAPRLEAVNVGSLEVGFQRNFGKFPSVLPEFEKINAAAYWDYQRSKVYVRTNKTIRRSVEKKKKPINNAIVEKAVMVDDRPRCCPRCGSSKIWIAVRVSHVVFDLKFTRRGIKRWTVRYHYNNYRCAACKAQMTPHKTDSKYGVNLRAYVAYLLIEMRLSNQKISDHLATVFDVPILGTMANTIKHEMAKKYELTYRAILEQISSGTVVHADETKGVVIGGGHYVWIFANLTSVAYVYSASREASILDEVLAGFNGVLVSDFYGGYDAAHGIGADRALLGDHRRDPAALCLHQPRSAVLHDDRTETPRGLGKQRNYLRRLGVTVGWRLQATDPAPLRRLTPDVRERPAQNSRSSMNQLQPRRRYTRCRRSALCPPSATGRSPQCVHRCRHKPMAPTACEIPSRRAQPLG
jgi:predicted RecB family nuclease